MSGKGGKRSERVAERIKVELMELLLRGAVRDPGVSDAYVTAVRVSDDLSHARVYVRTLQPAFGETDKRRVVRGLERAAGYLRRELSGRIELKHQPDLRFFWDEGVDRAARIEALLSEIEREGGT